MVKYVFPRSEQLETIFSIKRRTRLDRGRIVAFRNDRLRRLVHHAYQNVAYYRELFKGAGITPEDIRTEEDLRHIPITSKRDIQELPTEEILSRGIRAENLIVRRTSGSTGEASIIRRTWLEERILQGFRWRSLELLGWRMKDKLSNIGLPEKPQPSDSQLLAGLFHLLGLFRNKKVNCLLSVDKIFMALEEQRSHVISGYPGVLSKLAQFIESGNHMKNKPRFIAAGGETLISAIKDQISRAFGSPVYNLYGSHEFNLIAWECRETGELHTCDDSILLEVQKNGIPAQPGERGEVIGTSLHSFAMPFIRYRLGDVAIQGSAVCPCGLPFSTIRSVLGRMLDYFHLPDGRVLNPYEITTAVKRRARGLIRQHQIIQEDSNRIIMKVVPFHTIEKEVIRSLEGFIKKIIGSKIEFRIKKVDEIDLEPNGKFRVALSKVESDYEGIDWGRELFIS